MRIRVPLLIVLAGLVCSPALAKDTLCANGQSCLCDRLTRSGDALYTPSLLFCEDFEDPLLNNGDKQVYNDSAVTQYGTSAKYGDGWSQVYGALDANCMTPSLPGGQGIKTRGAEGANSWSCINIVQETACEVENDCVFEGGNSLAFRLQPQKPGGISGTAVFSPTDVRNFGVTMAIKVTSNYVSPKDSGSNGPANKMDEWGNNAQCIQGCSTFNAGSPDWPFAAGMKTFSSNPGGTMLRGQSEWDGSSGFRWGPTAADYSFDRDWGKGNWACYQMKWTGWGTSAAEGTYWINGKEIVHIKNLNMTTLSQNASGIRHFVWNAYYNGADGTGSGYTGSSLAYRLEDNVVITSSDPVPCAAIGFTTGGGTQALGAPGRPALIP